MYRRDVIGRFGPRLWSREDTPVANADESGAPVLCIDCAMPLPLVAPPFITEFDKLRAKADNERLAKLPGSSTWLGGTIAKAHLTDPRAPEALHNVVRATQYGEMDSDTSRAAYELLHSKFPKNPWTAKTPKWF